MITSDDQNLIYYIFLYDRAAKKSHKKLTRAFSFSRTPRRMVERAVSTMSPAVGKDGITAGLGATPSRAGRPVSAASQDAFFTPDRESQSAASGLTPQMSMTSLCTPQSERRQTRLSSASSMQVTSQSLWDCSNFECDSILLD